MEKEKGEIMLSIIIISLRHTLSHTHTRVGAGLELQTMKCLNVAALAGRSCQAYVCAVCLAVFM